MTTVENPQYPTFVEHRESLSALQLHFDFPTRAADLVCVDSPAIPGEDIFQLTGKIRCVCLEPT